MVLQGKRQQKCVLCSLFHFQFLFSLGFSFYSFFVVVVLFTSKCLSCGCNGMFQRWTRYSCENQQSSDWIHLGISNKKQQKKKNPEIKLYMCGVAKSCHGDSEEEKDWVSVKCGELLQHLKVNWTIAHIK